jgi:hypothetical protein
VNTLPLWADRVVEVGKNRDKMSNKTRGGHLWLKCRYGLQNAYMRNLH